MNTTEKTRFTENELAKTQKNKATNNLIGIPKAKMAKLRRELITAPMGSGGGEAGFVASETGISVIGIIGRPSVGKSSLISQSTGIHSGVAEHEFTTLTADPGVITYEGVRIQILDIPGNIEGDNDGKGKGRQDLGVARTCSLMVVCLDAMRPLTYKGLIKKRTRAIWHKIQKIISGY